MARENKTQPTTMGVGEYLEGIGDAGRRAEMARLVERCAAIFGEAPVLWGDAIVGYGKLEYRYASGRTGTWMRVGIASRERALTLYLSCDLSRHEALLGRLGKFTRGKGCLYLKRLADVDGAVLDELLKATYADDPHAGD